MKFNKKIICIFLVILIPLLILLLENKESFSLGGPSRISTKMKQLKEQLKPKYNAGKAQLKTKYNIGKAQMTYGKERRRKALDNGKERRRKAAAAAEQALDNLANEMISQMKISTDENGQGETITSVKELTTRIQTAVESQLKPSERSEKRENARGRAQEYEKDRYSERSQRDIERGMAEFREEEGIQLLGKRKAEEAEEMLLAQLSETDLKSVAANLEFRRLMQKVNPDQNPLINEKLIRKRLGLDGKLTNKYEREAPLDRLFRTRKETRSDFENATKMYTSVIKARQKRERKQRDNAERAAAKAKRNAMPEVVEARAALKLKHEATTSEEKADAEQRVTQALKALKLMREATTA